MVFYLKDFPQGGLWNLIILDNAHLYVDFSDDQSLIRVGTMTRIRNSSFSVHSVTKDPDPLSFLIAPLYGMIRD